jgi:hypothetical protein
LLYGILTGMLSVLLLVWIDSMGDRLRRQYGVV